MPKEPLLLPEGLPRLHFPATTKTSPALQEMIEELQKLDLPEPSWLKRDLPKMKDPDIIASNAWSFQPTLVGHFPHNTFNTIGALPLGSHKSNIVSELLGACSCFGIDAEASLGDVTKTLIATIDKRRKLEPNVGLKFEFTDLTEETNPVYKVFMDWVKRVREDTALDEQEIIEHKQTDE